MPYLTIHATVLASERASVEAALTALLAPIRPGLVFEGTFTLELSADGADPVTHYGTTSPILDEDVPLLAGAAPSFGGAVVMASTGGLGGLPAAESCDALAASQGLTRVVRSPF